MRLSLILKLLSTRRIYNRSIWILSCNSLRLIENVAERRENYIPVEHVASTKTIQQLVDIFRLGIVQAVVERGVPMRRQCATVILEIKPSELWCGDSCYCSDKDLVFVGQMHQAERLRYPSLLHRGLFNRVCLQILLARPSVNALCVFD